MRANGTTLNGYGVAVSLHRCVYCGDAYTVTPAVDDSWGLGCLTPICDSYDPARDADIYFAPDDPALIEGVRPIDPSGGRLMRQPCDPGEEPS